MSAASADVNVELTIHADGGLADIPRETLNLVTLEGLRHLGIHDVDVIIDEKARLASLFTHAVAQRK